MDQEFASESNGRESFHTAVNEEVTVKSFEAASVPGSRSSQNERKLEVIVATDTGGWNTTTNRKLTRHLSKDPRLRLRAFVPRNTRKWRELASNIQFLEDANLPGNSPMELLEYSSDALQHVDFLIMHCYSRELEQLAEKFCKTKKCKWIYVVHRDWGDFVKFFEEEGVSLVGRESDHHAERQRQIELCKMADLVLTIGPKIADSFKNTLQSCGKDTSVISIVPGIVSKLNNAPKIHQDAEDRDKFYVLVAAEYPYLAPYFNVRGGDIAVKAITLLQDVSYHVIFAMKSKYGVSKLTEDLGHAGMQLNQFTIKSIANDSPESFATVTDELDLLVLPSRVEGFGMSGLYAISANFPVLVSGNSGLGIALKKLPSGGKHVVDSEDPQVWAEKIKEVREKGHKTVAQEAEQLREEYMKEFSWEKQCRKLVEKMMSKNPQNDSTVPLEIRGRGPRAEAAFQKAMQNGRVKVYRGRIMFLGQDRAGKTSLKKSLLGMPFNPEEESTVGVEVDPSKCEVDVHQAKNWEPTKRKKLEVTEFVEDIARLITRDLNETDTEEETIPSAESASEQNTSDDIEADNLKHSEASPTVPEPPPDANQEEKSGRPSNNAPESSSQQRQRIQLNIDTTDVLPKDVTDLVVQYLQNLKLEDNIKAKEVILTLWDFAGQHLYYASHPVFLSERAVYVLVYNLSKSLSAQAEPCARQGIFDIVLDNPNNETNLDNLLSWLVSVHGIRPTTDEADNKEGATLAYRRPPVLIVGTHADKACEDARKMEKCIKENLLDKKYGEHVITPFFAVDNTKSEMDDGVRSLREKIMEVLKQEPYMGEEVPLRWFNFEKVVDTLVSKGTYYMRLDQLLSVTRQVCKITDKQELTTMLDFYHDLGVIVKHGQTVVLQAQWLIDLFKQLITVPPFDRLNARYRMLWLDLERCGILRMALVDHVFTDFIQKGLHKQDILDMMELYGLIAKFSCLSPDSKQEQRYFVPSQLTSSPSGLCEINPSQTDPCPLYLHFLDGFVPHGLFPQLLSKCTSWCSERGPKVPQLYHNGGRFFIGKQTIFDLILICGKRFIKVMLKQRNPDLAGQPSSTTSTAVEVRTFLMATLQDMSRDLSWLRNLQYNLCVACSCCLQSGEKCIKHGSVCCTYEDCLHLLQVPEEVLICPKSLSEETVQVHGLEKWFQVYKTEVNEEEMKLGFPEGEAVDRSLSLKGGTLSSDDLLLVAHELGTSWEMLGRALGLQPSELVHIEEDERKLVEKCYGVLRNWRQACGSSATYECLGRALQDPTVGRSDLAAKYCGICTDTFADSAASEQPLSIKSGTPSSDVLFNVASELGASWKMFGRALRLSDPILEQIEEGERQLDNKCHDVLIRWKKACGTSATYECLARALQHPVVGRSDLAVKYCGM